MKVTVTLLILLTLFSLNTFAQDYTHSGTYPMVPQRASVKGGYLKSRIPPTAPVSRWGVVSVFGSTTPQLIKRSPCLPGILRLSLALRSVRMVAPSHRGVLILPSVSGMRSPGRTNAPSPGIRLLSLAWRSVRMVAHSHRGVLMRPSVCGMRSPARTNAPSPGILCLSLAWRSVRMVAPSHRGVVMRPSVYGMRSPGRTNAPSPGIRGLSRAWRSVRMVAPSHRGVWMRPSVCGMRSPGRTNGHPHRAYLWGL